VFDETETSSREVGTVKFWNEQRGFGFLLPMTGRDVFVHRSAIIQVDGYRSLHEGQAVEFEVVVGPGGRLQADAVMVL
jgi:cold shock protein